jgi:methionyl aminopeptidase
MEKYKIKTKDEIQAMREGGKILAETLLWLKEDKIKSGISTQEIDIYTREFFEKKKVKPVFLGYYGFPAVICTSLNDAVIHGVPNLKVIIKEGDIVSLDCGVLHNNMIVDSAISFGVGTISEEARLLLERTQKSLNKAIKAIKAGATTGDIGYAIESYIDQFGYGIIRDYAGHGVGHKLHEEPTIPNYGQVGAGNKLISGLTIAVEPMITLGSEDVFTDADDGWTVYTDDGSLSAHFEHTILVTDKGAEILTQL